MTERSEPPVTRGVIRVSRDFATPLYHSPAWQKNRKAYLGHLVDTEGRIVYEKDVDGRQVYCTTDEYGYELIVPYERVVPPGMCERCFARGELRPAKVVHHIIHLSPENIDNPNISLSFDNFQRLCQDCHAAVHAGTSESRVTFDEMGNVVWKD